MESAKVREEADGRVEGEKMVLAEIEADEPRKDRDVGKLIKVIEGKVEDADAGREGKDLWGEGLQAALSQTHNACGLPGTQTCGDGRLFRPMREASGATLDTAHS